RNPAGDVRLVCPGDRDDGSRRQGQAEERQYLTGRARGGVLVEKGRLHPARDICRRRGGRDRTRAILDAWQLILSRGGKHEQGGARGEMRLLKGPGHGKLV